MQPVTTLAKTEETIRYLKEKACPICLDENFDGKSPPVQHCDGHVFHAKCLDAALRASRQPLCPFCKAPLIPQKVSTWREKIEWIISLQPWLLGVIYRKQPNASAGIYFCHAAMGLVDLYCSQKKTALLQQKIEEANRFLRSYCLAPKLDSQQESLKIYYEWLQYRAPYSLEDQDVLACLHLIRTIAALVLGFEALWKHATK